MEHRLAGGKAWQATCEGLPLHRLDIWPDTSQTCKVGLLGAMRIYIFINCLTNYNTCCFLAERLPPPPGECTFDQDECAFTQEKRNRSSWHRGRGETPTSYTGPKGDHTTGVGELRHMVLFPKNLPQHTRGHLPHFMCAASCLVTRMSYT